jgi:hypothetical protein
MEHHTCREDDVEEGGIEIKKNIFHENGDFFKVEVQNKILFLYSKSPHLSGCRRVR